MVYKIIKDANNQVANINELEPMKNVVNVGGNMDSRQQKIPTDVAIQLNQKKMHIYGLQMEGYLVE